ncbi:MAG TPA: bifunctional phosphopantothenoylcysteine decarboxylase/phosphopantothenate--cysteine ligase CoaBC [Bacteroidota bacterium]|nr:bifunctional phosphopantothenoylcysteine decarboxylase/phosphopantothenate--cysteine ligase CoaBC [Bacteroidota bacterium]
MAGGFNSKRILIGVTGGIAAYKVCYLVRELVKEGAEVKVVMTNSATKFVTPLTFSALSGNEVATDLWESNQTTKSEIGTRHIDLANWADLFLIAPASANTIAKLTYGLADNLLTVVALACTRPIVLAPTMDADMFLNPTTQQNLSLLRERGFFVIPAEEGEHASGLEGPGRLPEVQSILSFVRGVLAKTNRDLEGKKILVTAGPTYEPIDPVRFIGNRSSGKMGFAIATAAALRGASVTLVSGPVSLQTPRNVERIDVESAQEMLEAVLASAKNVDAVIMAAAVADFTPESKTQSKIKKTETGLTPEIKLTKTVDILRALGEKKNGTILVGFALETDDELANAREKLQKKNLDFIVLNSLRDEGAGFAVDTNVVTIIDKSGSVEKLPKLPKFDVANEILNRVRKSFLR